MNDIQFKELIELHINNELNKTFENEPCYEHFKDSYVIQENKYNLPLNNSLQVFNIEDIDYENGYISIINVRKKESLWQKKRMRCSRRRRTRWPAIRPIRNASSCSACGDDGGRLGRERRGRPSPPCRDCRSVL